MHRSRQWTIVTLLGFVGLVFMSPMGSGELYAQTIESVNIVSPKAVGIDSVFHVDVKVKDFDESGSLEVVVFLATTEETDASGQARTDTFVIGSGYVGDVKARNSLTGVSDPERTIATTEDLFPGSNNNQVVTTRSIFANFIAEVLMKKITARPTSLVGGRPQFQQLTLITRME